MAKKRDYKKEYREYHSKPEQRKNRSKRNLARRKIAKERGVDVKSIKGDVGHKKAMKHGGGNARSNLRVESVSKNRAHGGRIKGRPRKR